MTFGLSTRRVNSLSSDRLLSISQEGPLLAVLKDFLQSREYDELLRGVNRGARRPLAGRLSAQPARTACNSAANLPSVAGLGSAVLHDAFRHSALV